MNTIDAPTPVPAHAARPLVTALSTDPAETPAAFH